MLARLFDPYNYAFNLHTVPTALASVALFALAATVLVRERASRVSRLFAASCLTVVTWLFAFSVMYSARDAAVALWWARLAYLGVPLIPVCIYHFTLAVLRVSPEPPWLLRASWAVGLFFDGVIVFTDAMIGSVYHYWWGYYPRYGWLSLPYLAYFFGLMILTLRMYWRAWRTSTAVLPQRRARAFMIAFMIAYLGSVDYLAKFGIPVYPFGFIPVLGFLVLAARAIWRYRLMDVSLSMAAAPILERMSEAVLVLDDDGVVRLANPSASALLERAPSTLVGQPILVLLEHPRLADAVAEAAVGGTPVPMDIAHAAADGRARRLTVTLSPIRASSSEQGAVVCFLHDMTALAEAEAVVAAPKAADPAHAVDNARIDASASAGQLPQVWWQRSRWWMAAILILMLGLPIAGMAWMEMRQVRRSLILSAMQQHTATAGLVAEALQMHLSGLSRYLESFAGRPALLADLDEADRDGLRAHLRQAVDENPDLDRALIVDPDGRVIADYPHRPEVAGRSFQYRDWYRGALAANGTYISEIYQRVSEPVVPLVGIATPVRDAEGRTVAFLVGYHPIQRLMAWYVRSSQLWAGQVRLFDRRGVLATEWNGRDLERFDQFPPVRAALLGQAGAGEGVDPVTGEASVLSFRPIGSLGWAVVVHQPMSVVLAPWQMTAQTIVALSGGCIVMLVVLGLVWFGLLQRHGRALVALNGARNRYVAELQQMLLDRRRTEQALLVLNQTLERRAKDLVESQEALSHQTQILQSVLDSLADGVVVAAGDGRCVLINPAAEWILGQGQVPTEAAAWTERLGCLLPDAVTPCPVEELPLVRAMRGESVDEAELFVRNSREQQGAWVSINARPLRAQDGQSRGGVMVFRDITAHKRDEEALKRVNAKLQANQQELLQALTKLRQSHEELQSTQLQLIHAEKMESVGRLAAGVAHEVKNPLAITLLGLDFLSHHVRNGDQQVDTVLSDMQGAIHRADTVIRGLLDFSHAKRLSPEPLSLNVAIQQSLLLVKPLLTRGRIQLAAELSPDLPPIQLDRPKIEQVFVNCFMNAIQAMADGGTLTVRTYSKRLTEAGSRIGSRSTDVFRLGDRVAVAEVDDTGCGIPADYLGRVFDPFFTTKAVGKGTGLGLTVTKTIVELHRGLIQVSNRPEGGVRVTMMFPMGAGLRLSDGEGG